MKNKSLTIGTLILAIILMAGVNSNAQRGFRGAGPNPDGPGLPGLTEKQKTEIKAIREAHMKEMDALRTDRLNREKYPNQEAFQSVMLKKISDHKVAIRNLLSDDQKAIFDRIQARQGAGAKGNFAPRRGGCPCCQGFSPRGDRQGRGQGFAPQGNWQGRGQGFRGRW